MLVSQCPPDGPQRDDVRYLVDRFEGSSTADFAGDGVRGDWIEMWGRDIARGDSTPVGPV